MCQVIGQPRSTQRYRRVGADDEAALTEAIVRLASEYGRYGYRRVTALLRGDGWHVNHKRVERIWELLSKVDGAVKSCWPMACLYRSLRFGEEYLPVSALLVDKT